MVDIVTHSSDGSKEGLISGNVVGEGNGMSGVAKWWWCLNGGISMWNCRWDVFLVRIVKFFGDGFVRVREVDAGNVGGSIFTDSEESCDALLDSGVLLQRVY